MNNSVPLTQRLQLNIVLLSAMSLPMLVLYAVSSLGPIIVKDLHIAPGLLGYLILGSFGVASVLSLHAGNQVKQLGSRYALVVLFLSIALAFTIMVCIPKFWGLTLAALVCGFAQALANPATNLLITQKVAATDKAFVVGLKQSGVQMAALFAGLVLPVVALYWGWRLALAAVIPIALIMAWVSLRVTPKKQPTPKRSNLWKIAFPNSYLQHLMAIQFCVGIALSTFVTFIPLFATSQGVSKVLASLSIALFGLMGILSRIGLTSICAKLKDESILLFALTALAALCVLLLLLASSSSHWPIGVSVIGMGLTAVATNAIAMSMILRNGSFGPVPTASGLLSFAFFGGFALGPVLMGSIINTGISYHVGWVIMAMFLFTSSLLSIALKNLRAKSHVSPHTQPSSP